MGLFSKKDNEKAKPKGKNAPGQVDIGDEKIPSSAQLHEPVLTAVQELQPYELSNQAATQAVSPSGALRDVFGNAITNPDISNPARAREERPLDTIRSFEYASTGDERFRGDMETTQLGFRPRKEFVSLPQFESNPYAPQENVISFGDPQQAEPERKDIYFPPRPAGGAALKEKKKGGLFRKKDRD